jgi:DNA polymerase III subunit beta
VRFTCEVLQLLKAVKKESISVKKEGQDLKIGLNGLYLIEMLKTINNKDICVEFRTATTPLIIKGCDFKYLQLPVRIR